jgi:ligand-binding SRPBCC domain-containing protein
MRKSLLHWRSRIEIWDPPRRFVDVHIRGPYRLWRHEHLFDPWEQGTLCLDRVLYAAPSGKYENAFLLGKTSKQSSSSAKESSFNSFRLPAQK